MATINISGNAGGGGPKNVRGAAWDAYQTALNASQAADAKKAAQVDAAWAAKKAQAEKQSQAAWGARQRQEAAARKAESALLKDELRASETIARNRQRAVAEAKRAQSVKDRADTASIKRSRQEADYENRVFNARTRKKKQAEDTSFRMARGQAEFENRLRDRAYRPFSQGISAVGSRGVGAIRDYDPIRALGAKLHLNAIDRRARNGVAAGGPQAAHYQRVLQSVAEARSEMTGAEALAGMGSPGLGKALGYGYIAYKAAQLAWNAPRIMTDKFQGFIDAAAPYQNLQRGAANLGGGGGFNGSSLADRLTGKTSSWQRVYGMTGADALDTIGAFGVAPRSQKEALAMARDAAGAEMAPYLQGMGRDRLASMAGGYESIGGSGGRLDYYRRLQKSMQTAVTAGVDRTKMADVITRVQGLTASAGGNVSMASSADYVARTMAAGGSGARSGASILDYAGAVHSSIDGLGFGGNTMGNMAAAAAIRRKGMPNTPEKLRNFLGMGKDDRLSGGQQQEFDDALAEAKSGSVLSFLQVAGPLLHSDVGQRAFDGYVKDYAGSSGLRPSLRTAMQAGILGSKLGSAYDANAGGLGGPVGSGKVKGGLGWAELPTGMQQSILQAAAKKGVRPEVLAGLINYESSFQGGAASGTGANGYGQITRSTFDYYKSKGLLKGYTYGDVGDSTKGPEVAAEILAAKTQEAGGNEREGLRRYHGLTVDQNGVGPDDYADSVYGRSSIYANSTPELRAQDAGVGQMRVDNAAQQNPLAKAAGEGIGKAAEAYDHSAATFSGAVEKFALAVSNLASGGGTPRMTAPIKPGSRYFQPGDQVVTP